MLKPILRLTAAATAALLLTGAFKPDPVQWSATAGARGADGSVVLTLRATIERGWYIYSMQQPADGPAPLRFRTPPAAGSVLGNVTAPAPEVSYDQGFRARVGKYYGSPSFSVRVRPNASAATVPLEVRYQACNDTICLPPRTKTVEARLAAARR